MYGLFREGINFSCASEVICVAANECVLWFWALEFIKIIYGYEIYSARS